MKLHDNSRLRGIFVVGRAARNRLKTNRLVAFLSGAIGLPDFQIYGTGIVPKQSLEKMPGDALAAEFRSHGQVQDLKLLVGDRTQRHEAGNPAGAEGDQQMMREVIGRVPLRGPGTGGLNLPNGGEIAGAASADYWHI